MSFGVAGTFAQLMANTSRVIIVNYSMPVWGSLMAYFVLRERINARAALGLALCVAGLGVLVYPSGGNVACASRSACCSRWSARSAGAAARST